MSLSIKIDLILCLIYSAIHFHMMRFHMSKPKYQEIADAVIHLIDIGHYKEGSKLPTHRALAAEYSTTPVTIAKAYTLLAEQGHIESFVGRGSFVKSKSSLRQAIQSQFVEDESNFSKFWDEVKQLLENKARLTNSRNSSIMESLVTQFSGLR